jgi:adenosine deaminase/adenosine deaminase CECR1
VIIALALLEAACGAESQNAKGYALVIGISGYPHYAQDKQVRFGDKDAESFAAFIRTPKGGAFDVTLIENEGARRTSILEAIKRIGDKATASDVVYVFFAGHGAVDEQGLAYFMPYDADPRFPEGLGIRMDEFLSDVGKRIVANTIFFIDACHAGAALSPGGVAGGARGDLTIVPSLAAEWDHAFHLKGSDVLSMGMFAASSNELSWEDADSMHGLFTKYLLEGLNGAADTAPADGKVTAQELYDFVASKVEAESTRRFQPQNPTRSPGWAGSFPLALTTSFQGGRTDESAGKLDLQYTVEKSAALAEARAEEHFERVKSNLTSLQEFAKRMPKGADLDGHLSGMVPPEDLIEWAAQANLCVDPHSFRLEVRPCEGPLVQANLAVTDWSLYEGMINAFSMRGAERGSESAYDHFNDTFAKFALAVLNQEGRMLAVAAQRAASQGLRYQEIMMSIPGAINEVVANSESMPSDVTGYPEMRQYLLARSVSKQVEVATEGLSEMEKQRDEVLRCKTSQADPGCGVKQRYTFMTLRGLSQEKFFAFALFGFELARQDGRIVGVGMAQPEQLYVARRDFDSQMQMIRYLHQTYPGVHIAIPAGQLAPDFSLAVDGSPIRSAVEIGHANRVDHATSLPFESSPEDTIRALKEKGVAVVCALTSDDLLLGIRGDAHPLTEYLRAGIPVVLSTSDDGLLGTTLTREFARAIDSYNLTYQEVKQIARNSLSASFAPGQSLWSDVYTGDVVSECRNDAKGTKSPSMRCAKFLDGSEKASLQWELEREFSEFESTF